MSFIVDFGIVNLSDGSTYLYGHVVGFDVWSRFSPGIMERNYTELLSLVLVLIVIGFNSLSCRVHRLSLPLTKI